MKLTIYNVYVVMESQKQCDRMKKLCIDNNLPYWDDIVAFEYDIEYLNYFSFSQGSDFAVWLISLGGNYEQELIKVTEKEFINLLNTK